MPLAGSSEDLSQLMKELVNLMIGQQISPRPINTKRKKKAKKENKHKHTQKKQIIQELWHNANLSDIHLIRIPRRKRYNTK